MIWANIVDGFDASYAGAQGPYLGKHVNPNLMQAMMVKNGLASIPEVRTDALIYGGGVSAMRFIQSKNFINENDGYLCFVVVNGAAAVVARSERLKDLSRYMFFKDEGMCCNLLDTLKINQAITLGARVSLESLDSISDKSAYALGRTPKVRAYRALRAATTEKYRAGRAQTEITLHAAAVTNPTSILIAALAHVNAWALAADTRHAVALQQYQAVGGLI